MSDNLYLFANNNGGQAENNGSYRLYGMKIEGDNERNFQPALDSNNIPCLLDKISNKFFYNKGTSQFKTNKTKYKKVSYLKANGTGYINTNVITKSGYRMEFIYNDNCKPSVSPSTVCGVSGGPATDATNANSSGVTYRYHYVWGITSADKNTFEREEFSDSNNNYRKIVFNSGMKVSAPMYIFANNSLANGATDFMTEDANLRLYEFKIWNEKLELVRNFIPVLDENDEPCLYDLVTNEFFYNQGTGRFGYGIDEYPTEIVNYVEYLEGDGNSWIDTEIACATDYTIDVGFKKKKTPNSSGYTMIYGVGAEPNIGYDHNGGYGIGFKPDGNSLRVKDDGKSLFNPYTTVDFTNYFGKNYNYRYKLVNATCSYSMYLFANDFCRIENRRAAQNIADSSLQIFYLRITNASGSIVRDLRPCLDTKGIPCMYDRISKKYFHNKGTGTFGYGDRIGYQEIEYIESNGTQYIDTGIVSIANTDIDMTCRLSAKPYICFKDKCGTSTVSLSGDTIIEMDFKYGGTRLGDSRALEKYLYILEDGSYSLDGSTSTGVLASTSHYDNLKFILSLTEGKEYLYVNGIKVGEKTISSLSKLGFGGNFGNCATFYMHYANVYKKSDLTPIALLTPVMADYVYSSPDYTYTYHIPKLYDSITGNYYMTSYGDATDMKYIDYGYDKNYIYNNLKLLNILKTQNSESNSDARKRNIYDRTVYEYNGINTTVQPNLVASEGATLTMGSQNIDYLTEEELAQAVLNGWTIQ